MPHHLSASKVDLALNCSYWAREDVELPSSPPGRSARIGTQVHAMAEAEGKGSQPPDPIVVDEQSEAEGIYKTLRVWVANRVALPMAAHEYAIVYDTQNDTTRHVFTASSRDYGPIAPSEIPMTIDLFFRRADGGAELYDYKTGKKSNVSSAAINMQIATMAVAVSRLVGTDKVTGGLVFPMKTKCTEDVATLDGDALDEHAGRLRKLLRMLPESQPNKGEWCWRCELKKAGTCPAYKEQAA